jgi:hypothetical protein
MAAWDRDRTWPVVAPIGPLIMIRRLTELFHLYEQVLMEAEARRSAVVLIIVMISNTIKC